MQKLIVPVLTTLVVIVTMTFLALTPATTICEAPKVVLDELPGYTSEELPISEAEINVLPGDTQILKRLYTAPNGHWYAVSLVIGGTSKSSIHRPELCLPSQGFLMTNPHTVELTDSVWRVICLDGGRERPSLGFAYTFFNQAGYKTASHMKRIFRDVWDRSFYNRIDRWVMITVNSSRSDDLGITEFLTLIEGLLK